MLAYLLAVAAINIDSLAVGIAYGLAEMKMSRCAKIGVSLAAGLALWLTVWLGNYCSGLLDSQMSQWLSAVLLLLFGNVLLISAKLSDEQILNYPDRADSNKDKVVSFKESLLLGAALSVDSLGAGFSLGMMGSGRLMIPLLVFLINFVFLCGGELLGKRIINVETKVLTKLKAAAQGSSACIPGVVLIALAVWKIVEIYIK